MKLLLTRPRAESEALASRLEAMGIESVIEPLLDITPLPHALPAGAKAALVTSRHAIHTLPEGLPVYAVGESTREALIARGQPVAGSAPTIAALLPMLHDAPRPLLYLRGEHVTAHVTGVVECIVYRAVAAEKLSAALHEINGAVFFSTRTAQVFLGLCEQIDALQHLTAFALSEAVAEPLRPFFADVKIASAPTLEAMLALVDKHARLA